MIGSFGIVYAGKCRQKDVAVKVLLNQNLDEKTLRSFKREVEIMRYYILLDALNVDQIQFSVKYFIRM